MKLKSLRVQFELSLRVYLRDIVFVVLFDKDIEADSHCTSPQTDGALVCLSAICKASRPLCAPRRDNHALRRDHWR
jgi:hypothetical protein